MKTTENTMLSGERSRITDSTGRCFLSTSYAESTSRKCHLRQRCHRWQVLLHVFCTFFLLLLPCLAQPKSYVVSFHTVHDVILLDATVNGRRAVLMLDTGANGSIIDAHTAGFDADKLSSVGAAGARAACSPRLVRIKLEGYEWFNPQACVMDLSSVTRNIGAHIDGFLGQDVLRRFSRVCIDYKAHTVTLEN